MTGPDSPHLDCPISTPDRLQTAPQPVDAAGVGEPKGAARKGVVTALFPNRSTARPGGNPTLDAPGIRIFAPPVYRHHYDGARWSTRPGALPTAAYACRCGQTGSATGPEKVAALVAEFDAHRSTCTGAPAATSEGRAAA
jgi:transposase